MKNAHLQDRIISGLVAGSSDQYCEGSQKDRRRAPAREARRTERWHTRSFSKMSAEIKQRSVHGSGFSSATSFVKYEAHSKMMFVDVDAAMAENQKPLQWLGSWVCMGLNSAVSFLGRFHPIELGSLLFCLSAFVRGLYYIGLEFWPFSCVQGPKLGWKLLSLVPGLNGK